MLNEVQFLWRATELETKHTPGKTEVNFYHEAVFSYPLPFLARWPRNFHRTIKTSLALKTVHLLALFIIFFACLPRLLSDLLPLTAKFCRQNLTMKRVWNGTSAAEHGTNCWINKRRTFVPKLSLRRPTIPLALRWRLGTVRHTRKDLFQSGLLASLWLKINTAWKIVFIEARRTSIFSWTWLYAWNIAR